MLVNARVAVIGALPALPQEPRRGDGPPAAPHDRRRIWLGDWHEAPVFDVDALRPGQILDGPAIVELATTTALLRPGDRARGDRARLARHRGCGAALIPTAFCGLIC